MESDRTWEDEVEYDLDVSLLSHSLGKLSWKALLEDDLSYTTVVRVVSKIQLPFLKG